MSSAQTLPSPAASSSRRPSAARWPDKVRQPRILPVAVAYECDAHAGRSRRRRGLPGRGGKLHDRCSPWRPRRGGRGGHHRPQQLLHALHPLPHRRPRRGRRQGRRAGLRPRLAAPRRHRGPGAVDHPGGRRALPAGHLLLPTTSRSSTTRSRSSKVVQEVEATAMDLPCGQGRARLGRRPRRRCWRTFRERPRRQDEDRRPVRRRGTAMVRTVRAPRQRVAPRHRLPEGRAQYLEIRGGQRRAGAGSAPGALAHERGRR